MQFAFPKQRIFDCIQHTSRPISCNDLICIDQPFGLRTADQAELNIAAHSRHIQSKFRKITRFGTECGVGSIQGTGEPAIPVGDHKIFSFGMITQHSFFSMPPLCCILYLRMAETNKHHRYVQEKNSHGFKIHYQLRGGYTVLYFHLFSVYQNKNIMFA